MSYLSEERNVELSERGKEINASKYKSVVSERQRSIRTTKVEIFKCKFAIFEANKIFEIFINELYKVHLDLSNPKISDIKNDFLAQKSADKKRNFQIANYEFKVGKKYYITVFNESADALYWTTYHFKPTFFTRSIKFIYRETHKYNVIHERLSPKGSAFLLKIKSLSKKRFYQFIKPMLETLLKKNCPQTSRKK